MSASKILLAETGAHSAVLNRPDSERHVADTFGGVLKVLKDVIDYGTHLLVRCLQEGKGTQKEITALAILFKQQLGFADGVHVLLSAGCATPALLLVRAAFEASIYAEWVLAAKSQHRARAYYVWTLRKRLKTARTLLRGTPENLAYRRLLSQKERADVSAEVEQEVKTDIAKVTSFLRRKHLRAWNARFDALYLEKQRRDVEWFRVLFRRKGAVTLATLAQQLKRRTEYEHIYGRGSDVMHSRNSYQHVKTLAGGFQVGLIPLRSFDDFGQALQNILAVLIHSYRVTLKYYRPQEWENFKQKYLGEWQATLTADIEITPVYDFQRLF